MSFETLIEIVSVCCDVVEIIRKLSKLIAKLKERKDRNKYRPTLRKS